MKIDSKQIFHNNIFFFIKKIKFSVFSGYAPMTFPVSPGIKRFIASKDPLLCWRGNLKGWRDEVDQGGHLPTPFIPHWWGTPGWVINMEVSELSGFSGSFDLVPVDFARRLLVSWTLFFAFNCFLFILWQFDWRQKSIVIWVVSIVNLVKYYILKLNAKRKFD